MTSAKANTRYLGLVYVNGNIMRIGKILVAVQHNQIKWASMWSISWDGCQKQSSDVKYRLSTNLTAHL